MAGTDGSRGDTAAVRRDAHPLTGPQSLDPLLARIGDARYVAIGEATHGTAEFYRWRAELTRRLIEERGFSLIAVEGDWPDCHELHYSVTATPGAAEDPARVLGAFDRWPRWMWANTEVVRFTRWLREYNNALPAERRVGFFGLDVYSLWESLHAVLDHLRAHDPDRVDDALAAYRCFEPYAEDPQNYALATRLVPEGCEMEVVTLLAGLRERAERQAADAGPAAEFAAWQNAETVAGAERYYRAMVRGGPESWNIRDQHMVDTLDRLMGHLGPGTKAVLWEHNTHIGDARATDMAEAGMVNVGQLLRERHRAEGVVLVGFGSYEGTVVAAAEWGLPPEVMTMPPARRGSVEHLLHQALPGGSALFTWNADGADANAWRQEVLDHRAVGVVYRPRAERWGNYVPTVLGERYDAFLYLDRTEALTPLHRYEHGGGEEDTYPSGL
ncbi:erythromycin esterase family protein [Streptomyces litchfieldiae]|uniref:Erythromycin esterase family protein n=1 Tax=Streptomyces litchfieldiae TaxID=3075543 RepID=A0ABU2N0Q8_9ACTN|nr:erythromycin esterase family protein [Streptomyces sp. DSM 44938]MDT0346904.1 erythromycin esterase family protein [Streptomyces sp. DSM 44938]